MLFSHQQLLTPANFKGFCFTYDTQGLVSSPSEYGAPRENSFGIFKKLCRDRTITSGAFRFRHPPSSHISHVTAPRQCTFHVSSTLFTRRSVGAFLPLPVCGYNSQTT